MANGNLIELVEQGLLRQLTDQRPRPIEVGNAAIVFGQFDVAAGFTGYADKCIGKPTAGKQSVERRLIVFTEKTADGDGVAQVGQYLGNVHALARGMGQQSLTAIDFARVQMRQAYGQVQGRVKGDGQDSGHQSASTKARTSSGLPTLKA